MTTLAKQITFPKPLLGFAAYSGTGKTTLLVRLLPILKKTGLRIGIIKHAHHSFEIDHPRKDSYELRAAGANEILITSRRRMAWIRESDPATEEPTLTEALELLDPDQLDLVLVEGFKEEAIPKIELHRPLLGKPLIFQSDPNIIAIATDAPLMCSTGRVAHLSLNAPAQIAAFVLDHCGLGQHNPSSPKTQS